MMYYKVENGLFTHLRRYYTHLLLNLDMHGEVHSNLVVHIFVLLSFKICLFNSYV